MKKTGVPANSLPKLKELSEFVDEIANVRHDPRQPWVGQTAFAHKGGMHVHAIDRVARSYEHIDPDAVGNFRRVLVSDMSGRTQHFDEGRGTRLQAQARHAGGEGHHRRASRSWKAQGYEFEAAEASLALLIGRTLKHREPAVHVDGYHVSMRRDGGDSVCEATVKVRRRHSARPHGGRRRRPGERARRRVAAGAGEILSATQERDAHGLQGAHPRHRHRHRRAKRACSSQSSDGKREWGTVGVSENIIEASLQALVDSMEYALLKK